MIIIRMIIIIFCSIYLKMIQDSRTLMVTYTYRICSEMKKWRFPAECATEQIQVTKESNIDYFQQVFLINSFKK